MARTSFLIQLAPLWVCDHRISPFTIKCSISLLAQFRTENRSTLFLESLRTLTGATAGLFPLAVTILLPFLRFWLPEKEKPRRTGAFHQNRSAFGLLIHFQDMVPVDQAVDEG